MQALLTSHSDCWNIDWRMPLNFWEQKKEQICLMIFLAIVYSMILLAAFCSYTGKGKKEIIYLWDGFYFIIIVFVLLQFLENQGFLASVSNENEVQVLIFCGSCRLISWNIMTGHKARLFSSSIFLYVCIHSFAVLCFNSGHAFRFWQVWDLERRCITSNLQWESNITAFSVIYGTHYM